jgi:hypothetical protein
MLIIPALPACPAQPGQNQVLQVGLKAVPIFERLLEQGGDIFVTFDGAAAYLADQVMVVAFLGVVIDDAVSKLAFIDAAGFFQEFQGAVDGGLVHPRHARPHVLDDVFGGEVLDVVVDELDDETPLGRQPHPLLFQHGQATHIYGIQLRLYGRGFVVSNCFNVIARNPELPFSREPEAKQSHYCHSGASQNPGPPTSASGFQLSLE